MRILVISQYFPPETGGTSNRLGPMATGLAAAGHEVHVIAEKPNHPAGVTFEGYEKGFFLDRSYRGVPVTHAWVYATPEKTFFTRLLFYLSFMVTAVLAALRRDEDVDVVLASSPPLFVGVAGRAIAWLKRARFVFDVRDPWPEVAVAMGELREGWAAEAGRAVERFIYRGADGITAVTEGFCEGIRARVDHGVPIRRIPNGTVPEQYAIDAGPESLRGELDLPASTFIATYAGNVGVAQGLGHLLEAARRLDDAEEEMLILVVGDGPAKSALVEQARTRGLRRIVFRDRVPLPEAARYMAASDALLVPLRDRPIFRSFVPSKLFDGMAAGRPLLLSVDGEARDILREAGAGLHYPAEDDRGLVEAMRTLRDQPERAGRMGADGRRYVSEHYTRAEQARTMARFLEEVA